MKCNRLKYFALLIIYYIFRSGVHIGYVKQEKIIDIVNLFDFYRLYCNRFDKEFWPILGLSKEMNYRPELDLLVIGSDEVFNYVEAIKAGYSEELFGADNRASKLISFAGSFGCTRYDDLQKLGFDKKIHKYLMNFDAISVRDKNSKQIVEKLTNKICEYHLDPVLHYDFSNYIPEIKSDRKYVAVYAYSGLSEEFKTVIKKYAKDNDLYILTFMGYQQGLGLYGCFTI